MFSALKADRKRLKAEKFDLLNQMKQLYASLEDKERELRDFIRNYEQVKRLINFVCILNNLINGFVRWFEYRIYIVNR